MTTLKSVPTPSSDRLREYKNTDLGNARRLVDAHGERFRHVGQWGTWLTWDGTRWLPDTKGRIVEAAKQVALNLYEDALTIADSEERKKAVKWALASEAAGRIEAMVKLARTDPVIPVEPDELDTDPWLLNLTSGTLDLRTGEHRTHRPENLITKVAPVSYDSSAEAPRFGMFLEQILPDADVREFVNRWFGYCLTGDISEQKIMFAVGPGGNGKTTLNEAMASALGDYAGQAAPDLLMRRRDDPHPTGIADLHGARLILASETAQGRKVDEALVKRLTGGDRIKARRMHRDFFEFDPTHKIIVSTNHRPEVEGTDHGIWRRLRLVPFDVTIADDQQDRHLPEHLTAEAPGILQWALHACLRWQQAGLTDPLAVTIATADYRAEMDAVGAFISDHCVLTPNQTTRASDLYKTYLRWAEAMGEHPASQRKLGISLGERGLRKRTSNGVWWDGIRLNGTMEPSGMDF